MHAHAHTEQGSGSLGGLTDRWDFITDKTVLSSNWKHQTPVAHIMTGAAALISAPSLNDSFIHYLDSVKPLFVILSSYLSRLY